VVYVWLDALFNYLTALGYGSEDESMVEKYWPAKLHIVGKDILKFHAVYWPAFLMSIGYELPKKIAAHGWWTRDGEKMSKSKGNVINPKEVADAYGVENFRYFMLREVPFGADGDFSEKALIDRINNDLGNDLGNLLNRIIGMAYKYFDGKVTSKDVEKYYSNELNEAREIVKSLEETYLWKMQIHKFLEELWKVLSIGNKAIDTYKPWELMKNNEEEKAAALIGLIANLLAMVAVNLHAVMPKTTQKIASALGFEINPQTFKEIMEGKLLDDFVIQKIPPLFPKIEKPLMKKEEKKEEPANIITIDEFFKVELKVGEVVAAEEVKKSKKLLRLEVDLGEEKPRQIVAGIKEYYKPEELIGTQVCVVSNLKPAKLMGMVSEGMLLAAKDDEGLSLIRPEKRKKTGTQIK
jgi:methionyl-tRNA synthetase